MEARLMPDIRRRLRSADLPDRDSVSARSVFRVGSRLFFVLVLAVGVFITITADIFLVTILATMIVVQALYVVLPIEDIRNRFRRLYTGDAGDDVYEELDERREGGGRLR